MAIAGVEVKKVKWRGGALSTAVGLELQAAAPSPRVMDIHQGADGEAEGTEPIDARDDEAPIDDGPPPDDEVPL